MNLFETIFIFFASLSLILSVFMFIKKRGDKVANRLLGFYLLLFAINLCYNVLYWSRLIFRESLIHLYGFLALIWVSYPPLMHLYVTRVSGKKLTAIHLLHILPTLVFAFLYSRLYLLDATTKLEVAMSFKLGQYIYGVRYVTLGVSCVMLYYLWRVVKAYRQSDRLGVNIKRWLAWIIGAFTSYVIAMITYFVLSYFQLITVEHDYFIMYFIVFSIGLVTYFGFMQPEVFDGLSMDKVVPFVKYKKSGLTKQFSEEQKAQLLKHMATRKPYLNSSLRLNDLAQQLNLSRNHTSQIINEHFDASFFYFINTYRVEEAKKLLVSHSEFNISDVIYSSGFNNRVSFYKAFKNHTGITPTQYRMDTFGAKTS